MATKPSSLTPNEMSLVAIKFLGLPIPGEPGQRAGEAGLGLRVGEVRGVSPETAARMIDLGTAELVEPEKPAKGAAK